MLMSRMPRVQPSPASAGVRHPVKSGGHRRWVSPDTWFLLPVLILFVALFVVPLARSLWWSMTDYNGLNSDYSFVGFANYSRLLSDSSMVAAFSFSLIYALVTTAVVTCLAIPLAVVLNQRFFARNFVRSAFFFPAIPSIAVLGLVWAFILSPVGSGALNSIIEAVGGSAIPWLSEPTLARFSVILVGVWSQLGWHAVLYLAYLQSIPSELTEVSIIDGANARQRFIHITLPLLTPAMTVSQLLLLTNGLKVYDLPFTLTRGGPGYSTYTVTQSIIQRGIGESSYGQASALAVVFMIIIGAVMAVQYATSRRLEVQVQ